MDDSSGKVAKLVQQKLEDYFNRQRVETEFDPSGKGIHTTTPLVVRLELSYLQAAEQQWKTKTKKKKNAKQKTPEQRQDNAEAQARDGERHNEGGDDPETEMSSPRVTRNSKIKSRIKGSEIERITKNAQTAMGQVSVSKIHSVHRYRPHLIPKEYLDLGKVAHVSHHVNAILNTEHAWQRAEEYDDREAARKYVEEKNESERKERDGRDESQDAAATTGNQRKKTPLWLRVEMEKSRHQSRSDKGLPAKQKTREDGRERRSSAGCHEMTGQAAKEKDRGKGREDGSSREDGRDDRGETRKDKVDDRKGENTDTVLVEETENEDKGGEIEDRGKKEGTDQEFDNVRNDGRKDVNVDEGGDGRREQGFGGVRNDGTKDAECSNKSCDGKVGYAEIETKTGRGRSAQDDKSNVSGQDGRNNNSGRDGNVRNGGIKKRDSKSKQKGDSGRVEKYDRQNSESQKRGDEKETSCDDGDDVGAGGGVGKDEVECGEEVIRVPGADGLEAQAVEDKRGEGAPRPGGSVGEGEGGRLEEYVRAESMVSLTAAANDDDDDEGRGESG